MSVRSSWNYANFRRGGLTLRHGLIWLILTVLGFLPVAAFAACDDVTISTFAELEAAIQDFNANCGNGDVLSVDLNGGSVVYSGQPTNVTNATTAELLIRDGTLNANGTGPGRRVLRTNVGNVTMINVLITGGTLGNGGALDVATAGNLTLINATVTGRY